MKIFSSFDNVRVIEDNNHLLDLLRLLNVSIMTYTELNDTDLAALLAEPVDEQVQQAEEIAADAEWLTSGEQTALAYGCHDLGTRCIISGGEVMELDSKGGNDTEMPY